jgi:hypothetical protein
MADLDKRDAREDWLKWAIEFMKRGLWAGDYIAVYGPHSPADYIRGEADAASDGLGYSLRCEFHTARGIHSIHDVRGVRIVNGDQRSLRFPLQRVSDLTPNAQKWLRKAKHGLAQLRETRKREQREISVLRNRMLGQERRRLTTGMRIFPIEKGEAQNE